MIGGHGECMKKPRRKRSSLENEVLIALSVLYLLICAAILSIHYLQPEGRETLTSSPSSSHGHFSVKGRQTNGE
jgi:hypothetical protein